MKKGVFCISFDTELLWGRHDTRTWKRFIWRANKERSIIDKLLTACTTYNIHATWAVVGHLFLDRCKKKKAKAHSLIRRPVYPWVEGDWFQHDPCSSMEHFPQWYGADILSRIKKTKSQDIGSHSFSHLIFGDPNCSTLHAEDDIKTCVAIARRRNVRLSSFVFPRNKVGHLSVMKKYGFTCFRGIDEAYQQLEQYRFFIPIPPPVYSPVIEEGLVNIRASMYFPSDRGMRQYLIGSGRRFQKAKEGIDRAIAEKKVFHLWTHPTDFADNQSAMLEEMLQIFSYVDEQVKKHRLASLSMREIASDHNI